MKNRLWGLIQPLMLFAGLAAVLVAGSILDGDRGEFLSIANQRDVLGQVSINGVLAVGMTLVILTGGIDLSVGSVMSLCTVVCAMLLMHGGVSFNKAQVAAMVAIGTFAGLLGYAVSARWLPKLRQRRPGPAVLLTFAIIAGTAFFFDNCPWVIGWSTFGVVIGVPLVGGLLGLVNGFVISRTRLQPFIVTLAMMIAAVGLAKYIAGQGGQIHPIYPAVADQPGAPTSFEKLGGTVLVLGRETLPNGRVREMKILPVPAIFFGACWLAAAFLLNRSRVGRYIYAIGGNEEASRLSGLPVGGVKLFVYTASGALAGLAAVLYCAQYTQGKADAGQMKELDAIAAVVIGGTSLSGGRGRILGTLVGVMIFGYLSNILQLHAVSSEIQDILKGVIIVAAAALQCGNLSNWVRSKQ